MCTYTRVNSPLPSSSSISKVRARPLVGTGSLVVFLFLASVVVLLSPAMDSLRRLGLSGSMSRQEVLFALGPLSYSALLDLRLALYHDAVGRELVHANVTLVGRRDTACKPITIKLAEDIWTITNCLQHNKPLPRTLLRNGKRSRETFETQASQTGERSPPSSPPSQISLPDPSPSISVQPVVGPRVPLRDTLNSPPTPVSDCRLSSTGPTPFPSESSVAMSVLIKELNIVKADISSLKSTVSVLSGIQQSDQSLRDEVANLRYSYPFLVV